MSEARLSLEDEIICERQNSDTDKILSEVRLGPVFTPTDDNEE